ncbi:uncharacterized protein LOC124879145 isoform X2 [Girardinichthys multiradiatus]|uniref:uncharacterized protein LOC124879145 isoform X2 n=1 Tax=Girardinichthys multiradiatus TaxID=208333 RepID=UPI001FABFC8F|nr:uncharacterized protein LOC124879145 isoform X2 [Girardinichthys multiradiatus]
MAGMLTYDSDAIQIGTSNSIGRCVKYIRLVKAEVLNRETKRWFTTKLSKLSCFAIAVMDASPFYGVPPIESDDSCLSDCDSDEDNRAITSDDTDEDSDWNNDAAPSTRAASTRRESAATSRIWQEVEQWSSNQ